MDDYFLHYILLYNLLSLLIIQIAIGNYCLLLIFLFVFIFYFLFYCLFLTFIFYLYFPSFIFYHLLFTFNYFIFLSFILGGLSLVIGGALMRSAQFGVYDKVLSILRNQHDSTNVLPVQRIFGVFDPHIIIAGFAGKILFRRLI